MLATCLQHVGAKFTIERSLIKTSVTVICVAALWVKFRIPCISFHVVDSGVFYPRLQRSNYRQLLVVQAEKYVQFRHVHLASLLLRIICTCRCNTLFAPIILTKAEHQRQAQSTVSSQTFHDLNVLPHIPSHVHVHIMSLFMFLSDYCRTLSGVVTSRHDCCICSSYHVIILLTKYQLHNALLSNRY